MTKRRTELGLYAGVSTARLTVSHYRDVVLSQPSLTQLFPALMRPYFSVMIYMHYNTRKDMSNVSLYPEALGP